MQRRRVAVDHLSLPDSAISLQAIAPSRDINEDIEVIRIDSFCRQLPAEGNSTIQVVLGSPA